MVEFIIQKYFMCKVDGVPSKPLSKNQNNSIQNIRQ